MSPAKGNSIAKGGGEGGLNSSFILFQHYPATLISTSSQFPFRGRGAPAENGHEFPFSGDDVELLKWSLNL